MTSLSHTGTPANEIVKAVKDRSPLSFKKAVTNEFFLYVVSLILFIVIWHWVAALGILGRSLATPAEVVRELYRLTQIRLAGLTLWGHIWDSARRILIGFSIASAIAIPLGLFMGLNRYVSAIVKPLFDLLKPMPPIAWISIAILWFGIGEPSKVFIIVIGTFVPCLLNSYNGIRLIEPELYDVVRVLGGKRWHEIIQVSFPAAFPAIFAGLQISMAIAWTCVLAAELVSSRSGLGWIIIRGMKMTRPELVIGGMIIIALVALSTTLLISWLEKIVCPWKREFEKD
ncbi:MAG TPA: ABC transporter permease [Desulfobacteraceae bacterium]|nr:ABC transporter permease [Desulfobacteraceae bacterium]